ncbi:MAG: hypothetical protein Kow0098_16560 [Ignavibacteriaceae bacterium]
MATIALIGADGSGKTTIAKMILQTSGIKWKYIYMGLNIESSNYSLPTSKLMYYLKVMKYKKKHKELKNEKLRNLSLHKLHDDRREDPRGKIGATARLINRIAEALYRQFFALFFQILGYTILFDRHFLFDASTSSTGEKLKRQRLSTKLHRWFLNNLYPKPGLAILLYAPAEVLYNRKGEADVEYLESRNRSFLKTGRSLDNFVVIDATQSIDKVFEDVMSNIREFLQKGKKKFKPINSASFNFQESD